MKLSIIIINYNVAELLKNCLDSIQKYVQGIEYEVIVIDNDSEESDWRSLISLYPQVHFIENLENEGFAVANNKAVQEANGEYVYILNPDTELEGDYLKEIIDFADSKPTFGSLGLRMHDASGHFLPESKRSIPGFMNSFEKLFIIFKKNHSKSYYRNDIPENAIAEVDILTGANLLIKKKIYEEVGGFDERYFMYGEDIDLCYTLINAGYQNYYYGKYALLHHKGQSTIKDRIYFDNFFGAMQIFIKKYYSKSSPVKYCMMSAGLWLRKIMAEIGKK